MHSMTFNRVTLLAVNADSASFGSGCCLSLLHYMYMQNDKRQRKGY